MRDAPVAMEGDRHLRNTRVAIEAGVSGFWGKYVGLDGAVIGIDGFGASAPASQLFPHFGFTVEAVVEAARALGQASVG